MIQQLDITCKKMPKRIIINNKNEITQYLAKKSSLYFFWISSLCGVVVGRHQTRKGVKARSKLLNRLFLDLVFAFFDGGNDFFLFFNGIFRDLAN